MKLVEVITIFSVVLLVTFTLGDGAPQWRPQGRFGKRLDQRFPISWQSASETDKDIDIYPVVESSGPHEQDGEQVIDVFNKLCVESSLPGLYKCYRKARRSTPVQV